MCVFCALEQGMQQHTCMHLHIYCALGAMLATVHVCMHVCVCVVHQSKACNSLHPHTGGEGEAEDARSLAEVGSAEGPPGPLSGHIGAAAGRGTAPHSSAAGGWPRGAACTLGCRVVELGCFGAHPTAWRCCCTHGDAAGFFFGVIPLFSLPPYPRHRSQRWSRALGLHRSHQHSSGGHRSPAVTPAAFRAESSTAQLTKNLLDVPKSHSFFLIKSSTLPPEPPLFLILLGFFFPPFFFYGISISNMWKEDVF